jgi:hypothetical protein
VQECTWASTGRGHGTLVAYIGKTITHGSVFVIGDVKKTVQV